MVLADKDWLIPTKPKMSLWRKKESKEENKKSRILAVMYIKWKLQKTSELVLHLAAGW